MSIDPDGPWIDPSSRGVPEHWISSALERTKTLGRKYIHIVIAICIQIYLKTNCLEHLERGKFQVVSRFD